ncbi:putative F-box protein At1g49610 [Silene latifolia]|uniref:putative F-box protein At1g49610 n=1 Tax=Silene latifolia TaxID=37657 RepID=UPI003D76E9A1
MNFKVEMVDRLSVLPDTILIHILSFLPTLDSVRTMLLKPFGTLWTLLPSLDFDDSIFDIWYNTSPDNLMASEDVADDYDGCSTLNRAFFIFVQNVLVRHRLPKITRFRVSIGDTFYYCIQQGNLSHELDSWIDFALKKNVEILEFNVGMVEPDEPQYKLPYTEFVSDSITELKLEILDIKLVTHFQMGLLRVMRLIFVEISNSVIHSIIQGCPLLKELEINDCFVWEQLIIDAPNNVEKLILDISICYDVGIIVNCPNLRSFWFTGTVNCMELQDLSSLVDVRFKLSSPNMEFKEFDQFMTVLNSVLGAKIVSFSCEFVTVLFYCMEKHLPQLSMNWKRVELSMWLTEKHIPGLCRMLRSSPYLEELVIDVTSWQSDFLQPIESKLDNCSMNEEDCCSRSLKSVVIYNISMCSYPCLVHLISILLQNATVLAELVIYYKAADKSFYESVLSSEQWTEFSNNLLTFPRASQHLIVSLFKER